MYLDANAYKPCRFDWIMGIEESKKFKKNEMLKVIA